MATIYQHIILAKLEATKGTDAVPTAAADAVRIINPVVPVVQRNKIDRQIAKQTMGNLPHVLDPDQGWDLSIDVELKPSGVAGVAPEWLPLMLACRTVATTVANTSVTIHPSTGVENSCTIYCYIDGVLCKATGCVGTASITDNVGEFPKANFKMSAAYIAPLNATVPAGATYDASKPTVTSSADVVTENGTAINVGQFSFDLGNDVQPIRTRGFHQFVVANRNPTASFDKLSVSTATEWQAVDSAASMAIVSTKTVSAGNNMKITMPNAVRDDVQLAPIAERYQYNLTLSLYETANGNDDQWSIELT